MFVSRSPQLDPASALAQDIARSLYEDFLCKKSVPGSLQQEPVGTISAQSCFWKSDTATLPAPRDGHARSPQRVAFGNPETQLYQHSTRWTRTISAKGCIWKSENTSLPAFRKVHISETCFRAQLAPRNHDSKSYEMQHWPRQNIVKLKLLGAPYENARVVRPSACANFRTWRALAVRARILWDLTSTRSLSRENNPTPAHRSARPLTRVSARPPEHLHAHPHAGTRTFARPKPIIQEHFYNFCYLGIDTRSTHPFLSKFTVNCQTRWDTILFLRLSK